MTPPLMERARDLRQFIESVSRVRDTVGVLSITVGIEPGVVGGRTSGWEIAVANDLAEIRHNRTVGRALARRSEETSTRLADVLDPTTTGRGRALYVALESGASHKAALGKALAPGARLGPVAHVLPLLALADEGEPAGLVSASRDGISVQESELGLVRDVARIDLEPTIGDWWPEMKGPARANPARGQHTVSQRDRYQRRLAAAYRHTLDEACDTLRTLARERSWTRGVLAGDPRTIGALDDVLRAAGLSTATIDSNLEGLRAEDAIARLETTLATLVAEERARLGAEVVSAANAVCGLVPVLAALAEGRVDRLLIDTRRTFPGVLEAGESLALAGPGQDATDLTDVIVARALATDAVVTPLSGDAADALGGCEGIAALLRW
jgi:hypothetical protein